MKIQNYHIDKKIACFEKKLRTMYWLRSLKIKQAMIEISEHCLAWNNKELCVLIISVSKLGVFTSFINIDCSSITFYAKT